MQPAPVDTAVLGIDPSLTATGITAVLHGRAALTETWTTDPRQHRPARLFHLAQNLRNLIIATRGQLSGPYGGGLVVAMENEIFMSNPTQNQDASAVQATYQQVLWDLDPQHQWLHYLPVNVAHVKKWLGAQQKDQILLQVFKRYHVEFRDHNQADAYALGMIGHAYTLYRQGTTWPDWTKPQLEVLAKLLTTGYVWEQALPQKVRKKKSARPL